MEGTDYLYLTVAALHQLRDSVVAAQGYLEIAQTDLPTKAQPALVACGSAIERANSLLTALEAYRVSLNTSSALQNVRLEPYINQLRDRPATDGARYEFVRIYRLPSVSAEPSLTEYLLMLVVEYIEQLKCTHVTVATQAREQSVYIYFQLDSCEHTAQPKVVNRKNLKSSELNQLDHPTLLLVTAKLLAQKMSANLTVSKQKIIIVFTRARQLKMEMVA